MEKISIEELKKLQEKYGFKLCKVKDSGIVNIRKHSNSNLEDIGWDEFERVLKKRGLAVYKSDKDFLKIMKDR